MEKQKSSWTYKDFLAYLMLYAANADLEVNENEKEVLFSKIKLTNFNHVEKTFNQENDYQRLKTIHSFYTKFIDSEEEKDRLFVDLKEMFLADQKYNSVEKAIFLGLRKILK